MKKKFISTVCCLLTCVMFIACAPYGSAKTSDDGSEALKAAEESLKNAYVCAVKSEAKNIILLSTEENQGENDIWDTQNHTRYTKFKVSAKIKDSAKIEITKIVHTESLGTDEIETVTTNAEYAVTAYISVTESIAPGTTEDNTSEQNAYIAAARTQALAMAYLYYLDYNRDEKRIKQFYKAESEVLYSGEIELKDFVESDKGTDSCSLGDTTTGVKYFITVYVSLDAYFEKTNQETEERVKSANIRAVRAQALAAILSAKKPTSPDESSDIFTYENGTWTLKGPWKATAYITQSGEISNIEISVIDDADIKEAECVSVTAGADVPQDAAYFVTVYINDIYIG